MKSSFLITLLFTASTCLAQVETYVIPDINFRNYLEEVHPNVIQNDSILIISECDTINTIDCTSRDISNLDGIQFFENLSQLNCSYNNITELLNIPTQLTHLNTSYCVNLDTIGQLPSSLTYLNCSYNQVSTLPTLPNSLEKLFCSVNTIDQIIYLPHNLTHIDCSFNNLTELPYLPNSLAHINCSYNQITALPDLPPNLGLIYNNPLNIFNNNIQCVGEYTEIFEELLGVYPECENQYPTINQQISLPEGWSIFSIYGMSSNMDLISILEPISEHVIMAKDNFGSVYLAEWGYNGVGDISLGQAYQIKTTSTVELTIEVEYYQPESHPININQGWNMIGYLRNQPASAELVLAELVEEGNLLIAKDYAGNVFMPSWGFNGIGDMEPGSGYQIKVQESTQLHFLPNNMTY